MRVKTLLCLVLVVVLSKRRLVRHRYTARMYEKHIWICAFMVAGAAHKCSMGEVDANHADEVRPVQ